VLAGLGLVLSSEGSFGRARVTETVWAANMEAKTIAKPSVIRCVGSNFNTLSRTSETNVATQSARKKRSSQIATFYFTVPPKRIKVFWSVGIGVSSL
jgi:hypothetical protein